MMKIEKIRAFMKIIDEYKKYKRGPSTDLWGIPQVMSYRLDEKILFIEMKCFLSVRYESNHFLAIPPGA